jgi:hypothetical protein
LVTGGWVLPEAIRRIDRGVRDTASVLGRVGIAKVVGTIGIEGEIGGKKRGIKRRLGVVEEGLLLVGRDCNVLESRRWCAKFKYNHRC